MGTSILFVAREFTDGGAAYLALRHLRHLAHSHSVDFVVTGATHPGLVQQLPKSVSFAALQIPQQAILHGLQACRESLVRLAPPCLQKIYDAVVGTSLFPDMAASTLFALSRGQRKVLVLLDEGLLVPGLRPDVRAAMTGAIHASDHLAPVSQALLTRLALD